MDDLRERLDAIIKTRWLSNVEYATLRAVLAHPERLMVPHKPSGASIRCPRCGEKQEVVFKYAEPEVKP